MSIAVLHPPQQFLTLYCRYTKVDDVIVALDEALRPAASGVAHGLRRAGRRVELVMEAKKMKWAFKVCALEYVFVCRKL
jgi:histidyl-tRNA synthetase